jgi:glycosyltransferase involved in cell wall biosynthesis
VNVVHLVVPDGVDDPARPSGGNVYDRRVSSELAASGWDVREHAAAGEWPWPGARDEQGLAGLIAGIPDGAPVLVDGLIACTAPAVLVPAAQRLALAVLVHMPLGDGPPGHQVADAQARECAVLCAARAVITTSSWTRSRLLERYPLRAASVHVATPGTDPAALAQGTADGGALLCVAAVTPHKGHDLLVGALASVADLAWHCVLAGSLDRDPEFLDRLRHQVRDEGIGDRVDFAGPLHGAELDRAYRASDALVLASQAETYGMVVIEALARGLPVIATAVGGLPEALGRTGDGRLPGILVPPGRADRLAAALHGWLSDAGLRQALRAAAGERRRSLPGWSHTAAEVAQVLSLLSNR